MNNGDKSAMPRVTELPGSSFIVEDDGSLTTINSDSGLTKREMFAMAAMQGVGADPATGEMEPSGIAHLSVLWADALLKELGK